MPEVSRIQAVALGNIVPRQQKITGNNLGSLRTCTTRQINTKKYRYICDNVEQAGVESDKSLVIDYINKLS